nr:ankyrin repeat domain-containing protein [Sulfurovaceae bacterium]
GNIDHQDVYGKTALIKSIEENDEKLVELLLQKGASLESEDNNGDNAYDYARSTSDTKFIKILNKYKELRKTNSNPKQLVKLLKNFTIDTPIKCTTHAWEASCGSCKEMDFDDFIQKVQEQWDVIKDELKELSPNLHVKIEAFIFAKAPEKWCKDTGLDLGWSNLIGLKDYCNGGGKPFEFVLKEPIDLEDETLTTFKEVIKKFKEKIEVRNDSNMLKLIFEDFEEKLNNNEINCNICPSVDGVDFYTDVEKFKSALELIFAGIIAKKSGSDTVEIKLKKTNTESVEIHIIHKDSFSNRTKEEMFNQAEDGDFKEIKENLTNLCDWSVEDSFEDKSYKVNYLRSSNINEIEELDREIDGFSHILRFYI